MNQFALLAWFRRGFQVRLQTALLIAGINTAIAALMSIEDSRPFWHPLISAHAFGFAIAYFLNCMRPWERAHSLLRLVAAVALGTVVGMLLVIVIKQYEPAVVIKDYHRFLFTMFYACIYGLLVSFFFQTRLRDTLAAATLHRAESERERLGRQAAEAQLKLMQAQIEPHFLFNTLANVQFLVETDPPRAGAMLEHLIQYLRAAIPQLREESTTLGQEAKLSQAYLAIIQMRMGQRLAFTIDIPVELAGQAFPPMVLLSLVENAVKHGIEPAAAGGKISISAARHDGMLRVEVTDTGQGLSEVPGQGVGLANIRERLLALYGERARLTLTQGQHGGAIAAVDLPLTAGAAANL
ncbi:MAG: histidine kinase [Betaproteobacteria bacterium]|nr:histidine kinase [Betaproteobacteria bacterium]